MINIDQFLKIVKSGKMFSIKFKKKDGTIRVANCKNFVKSVLKGGGRTLPDDYIVLVDRNKMGKDDKPYISVKAENIVEVKCGKVLLTLGPHEEAGEG